MTNNEEHKFLADVYKVSGFALMTPLGRYFLILSDLRINNLTFQFYVHLVVSIILFCFGAIMIQRAYEEIQEIKEI